MLDGHTEDVDAWERDGIPEQIEGTEDKPRSWWVVVAARVLDRSAS